MKIKNKEKDLGNYRSRNVHEEWAETFNRGFKEGRKETLEKVMKIINKQLTFTCANPDCVCDVKMKEELKSKIKQEMENEKNKTRSLGQT